MQIKQFSNERISIDIWELTGNSFIKKQIWASDPTSPIYLKDMHGSVISGDFDGDGKDEIAAFYHDGNTRTQIFLWRWTGAGLTMSIEWDSGIGNFGANLITGRVVAGDFDGDGKDEISTFYDDVNARTRMFLWKWDGTGLLRTTEWDSGIGNLNANLITGRIVAGDFDGDGKDEISTFYDDGNARTRMFLWKWSSAGLLRTTEWDSGIGNFGANLITERVFSSDFNGDGKDEIAAFYDDRHTAMCLFLWEWTNAGLICRVA